MNENEKPPGLGVPGVPIRHRARLRLEPVGEEWDGRLVPVDSLSYRPAGGWPDALAGVNDVLATDRLTYDQARELATRSVYRMYRVAGGPVVFDTANGLVVVVGLEDPSPGRTAGGGEPGRLLYGSFNQRFRAGNLLVHTARSAADLAALCLAAMGLPPDALSPPLPADLFPMVEWDATPLPAALKELCDLYGRTMPGLPSEDRP